MRLFIASCLVLIAGSVCGADSHSSPYTGEEHRAIKSLSEAEIADLLAGKGMGLAKAAELNGYPGPKHVLELASELELTSDQLTATERLYRSMQEKASALGRRIVDRERELERMFADRTVSEASLSSALARLGELQAQLREAHLAAHLAQAKILTAAQSAQYARLRGYDSGGHHKAHGHAHY